MLLNAADKALWRLALPMIFSNITVPLLGLVDTAVIGHLDSPVYLGGVAVGATATSFLFMLLLFLRMSTTGLTAQAWGAKDPQRLARAHRRTALPTSSFTSKTPRGCTSRAHPHRHHWPACAHRHFCLRCNPL